MQKAFTLDVFVIHKLTGHLVGKAEETRWLVLCQKAIECVCCNIKHSINGMGCLMMW